jgi:hypothetical protein
MVFKDRINVTCWCITIAIVAGYVLVYGTLIVKTSAIPYSDSGSYVIKSLNIADQMASINPLRSLIKSEFYLATPPAHRPPFLPLIAAFVLGPCASPNAIAFLWMAVRLVLLLTALYILTRLTHNATFVPAAAFIILSHPLLLSFQSNMSTALMMDQPFACMGLLVFSLVLLDDSYPSFMTAGAVVVAGILLILIKPAGLVFLCPLFGMRLLRMVYTQIPDKQSINTYQVADKTWSTRQILLWTIPYLVFILFLYLLYKSNYRSASTLLYENGRKDYLINSLTLKDMIKASCFIIPPWLMTIACFGVRQNRQILRGLLIYGLTMVTGWYIFNIFLSLTYAMKSRYFAAVMPIAVVTVLMAVMSSRKLLLTATFVAALWFFVSITSVMGLQPIRVNSTTMDMFGPILGEQKPHKEVGLLSLADRLIQVIMSEQQGEAKATLVTLMAKPYIDTNSLKLALRYRSQNRWSSIVPESCSSNVNNFDFITLCSKKWFLTKTGLIVNSKNDTSGTRWKSVNALNSLITSSDSPLHGCFIKRLEHTITIQGSKETITLWYLPLPLPPADLLSGLKWVAPFFRDTSAYQEINEQIQKLKDIS